MIPREERIMGARKKTILIVSEDFVATYRNLMSIIRAGGDPPCVHCDDSQIVFCAKTAHQCEQFSAYVAAISRSLGVEQPERPAVQFSPSPN